MPQFIPFVVKDASAADVTMSPTSNQNNLAFAADSAPSVLARRTVSIGWSQNSVTKANSAKLKLNVPIVRAINGVDTVIETAIATVDIRLPFTANDTERANLTAILSSAVENAVLEPVLQGTEGLW